MSVGPSNLIVALDNLSTEQIQALLDPVQAGVTLKVNDLILRRGFEGIRQLHEDIGGNQKHFRWMMDPKGHDIGNTVGNGIQQLHESGMGELTDLYTVHASGGSEMMKTAATKRDKLGLNTRLLAITVLTSLGNKGAREVYGQPARQQIMRLATLAKRNGMDGVVCSPAEARMLREYFGDDFLIVTPNIRLPDTVVKDDDQNPNRSRTPKEAIAEGASHIVVGRPITESPDPQAVITTMLQDIVTAPPFDKYKLERSIYDGTIEEILIASGNVYRKTPTGPFVRLTSKLLSDGYVNIGGAVESDPRILDRFTSDLADMIDEKKMVGDIVIGAAMGSVRISDHLGAKLGLPTIYTEKDGKLEDGTTDRHMLKRHKTDLSGKRVIISEDVITEATTTRQLIKIVQEAGGTVEAITCVANRTGLEAIDGIPLLGLWVPPQFGKWYDSHTPGEKRGEHSELPPHSRIEENPKTNWRQLVETMNG